MATEDYSKLLENVKNLILTGAPGTGKTYLARQIAEQMIGVSSEEELKKSEQYAFVQFHPSYDYTDFVEGLRPINNENSDEIGFKLKSGIFKKFCKNALVNLLNSKKPQEILSQEIEISNIVDKFIGKAIESQCHYKTTGSKPSDFSITGINKDYVNIDIERKENKPPKPISILKNIIVKALIEKKNFTSLTEFRNKFDLYHDQKNSYLYAIYEKIKAELKQLNNENGNEIKINNKEKKFIFVIDEINRGEISKIFGELFFSIDPSYRGEDGAVKTQYSNMHDDKNEKFYVPENVYIIGTMNDIDRSVESFDFAMRRRFAWEEITAEQSAENMELPEEVKNKMASLNKEISSDTIGLNSSYHIGGAYFLKLEKYNGDYSKLWKYHLEPLLREYLRGMPDAGAKLEKLKDAYDK